MKQLLSEFYGDNVRWFIGRAKTTDSDPLKLGRIRVRVFGLHTDDTNDIKDTDLPWAAVSLSLNIPNGLGNYQAFGVNDNDTVFGIFLDGEHSQSPLVLGIIPHNGSYQYTPENISQLSAVQPNNIMNSSANIDPAQFQSYQSSGKTISNIPAPDGDTIEIKSKDGTEIIDGGKKLSKSVRDSYIEIGYNFFINELSAHGSRYPNEQAAGIIGNLIAESDMNPTRRAGIYSENSWGIAQWNGSKNAGQRLQELQAFAEKRNQKWTTLEPQLHFIMYELTVKRNVGGYGKTITIDTLKSKSTVEQATAHFMQLYENPGVVYEHFRNNNSTGYNAEYNKRLKNAYSVLNSFSKGK